VLISPAYAQAAGGSPGGDIMAFLPMIAIIVVFYFLLIRPQQKRAKETKAMLSALQKGDEVVTAGGVVGRIAKLSDAYATSKSRRMSRSPCSAAPSRCFCPRAPSRRCNTGSRATRSSDPRSVARPGAQRSKHRHA